MGEDLLSQKIIQIKLIHGLLFNASKVLRKICYKTQLTQRKENMYRFLLMTTTAKTKIMLIN